MRTFSTTLRELAGLFEKTEAQIAEHGGLDPAYVRKLMSGQKRNPSMVTLIKLTVGLVYCPTRYATLRQTEASVGQHPLTTLLTALQAEQLRDATSSFQEQDGTRKGALVPTRPVGRAAR